MKVLVRGKSAEDIMEGETQQTAHLYNALSLLIYTRECPHSLLILQGNVLISF